MQITTTDIYKLPKRYYVAYCSSSDDITVVGECLLENRQFRLVTKKPHHESHTIKTLRTALTAMKVIALKEGVTKIAFDKDTSGIADKDYYRNQRLIQEVFGDTNIDIMICR